jgi:hypothetical protein
MMNSKAMTLMVVTLTIAACRSVPQPSDRAPQSMEENADQPKNWVRFHSQRVDGNEVRLRIINSFKGKKLVMFGELHGTKEMPAYTAAVVAQAAKKFQNVYVGLEFPVEVQKNIDRYMANGDIRALKETKFFTDPNFHSGRGSEAMIAMLNDLRKIPNIHVFCFDLGSSREARDTAMARRIISVINSLNSPKIAKTLQDDRDNEALVPIRNRRIIDPLIIVHTGNIHSRLVPGYGSQPNMPTMGSELIRLTSGKLNEENVMSILYRFEKGTAWNCQADEQRHIDCGTRVVQEPPDTYNSSNDDDRYFLNERELTDGHNYTMFIRDISASPPFPFQ